MNYSTAQSLKHISNMGTGKIKLGSSEVSVSTIVKVVQGCRKFQCC